MPRPFRFQSGKRDSSGPSKSPSGCCTQRQIDYIISLQEKLDWSDREMVEEARSQGIIVPYEGRSAVLKDMSVALASELIDMLKESSEE